MLVQSLRFILVELFDGINVIGTVIGIFLGCILGIALGVLVLRRNRRFFSAVGSINKTTAFEEGDIDDELSSSSSSENEETESEDNIDDDDDDDDGDTLPIIGNSVLKNEGNDTAVGRTSTKDKESVNKNVFNTLQLQVMDRREESHASNNMLIQKAMADNGIVATLAISDDLQAETILQKQDVENTIDIDTLLQKEKEEALLARLEQKVNELVNSNSISKSEAKELKIQAASMLASVHSACTALDAMNHNTLSTASISSAEANNDSSNPVISMKLQQEKEKIVEDHEAGFLASLAVIARLSDEQASEMIHSHRDDMAKLDKALNDERIRMQSKLDEKLSLRLSLSKMRAVEAKQRQEILDKARTRENMLCNDLVSNGTLDEAHKEKLIDSARSGINEIKDDSELEFLKKAAILDAKVEEEREAQLAKLEQQHETTIKAFMFEKQRKLKAGGLSSSTFMMQKHALLTKQRQERYKLQKKIDTQALEQLECLDEEIATKMKDRLKEHEMRIVASIAKAAGISNEQRDKIVDKHLSGLEALENALISQRNKQRDSLKERINERKLTEATKRKEEEDEKRIEVSEQEELVKNMLNTQADLSAEERERILAEHRNAMSALDQNLRINKDRQNKALTQKLAARKARQMEILKKKQVAELAVIVVDSAAEDNTLRRHREERDSLLSRLEAEAEAELAQLRAMIDEETKLKLREQEERVGALMAEMHIEKSRRETQIRKQDRAIRDLQSRMLEMSAQGQIDKQNRQNAVEAESEALLKEHQKNQTTKETSTKKMKREKSLTQDQKLERRSTANEIKTSRPAVKAAMKFKKILLVKQHKDQLLEMQVNYEKEKRNQLIQLENELEDAQHLALQQQQNTLIVDLAIQKKLSEKQIVLLINDTILSNELSRVAANEITKNIMGLYHNRIKLETQEPGGAAVDNLKKSLDAITLKHMKSGGDNSGEGSVNTTSESDDDDDDDNIDDDDDDDELPTVGGKI